MIWFNYGRQALALACNATRDATWPSGRAVEHVEQRFKDLIKQLGHAIDESLSESETIAEVIGEIKKEGYDVLLVLEATIGFNRRSGSDANSVDASTEAKDLGSSLTEQDQKFLKALSISLED